jgi:predicted dehydrogenase
LNPKKLNIGVVGVGHLGRWHVEQLKVIPDAELVGIFDTDSNQASFIAKQYHTTAFSSFEDLLEKVEAVSIVTPTTYHYSYAKKAFDKGKHTFIEKPITDTVEQGNELISISKNSGLILQVGHIERFNSAILSLENIIKNPLFIESHRLSSFNPRGTDVAVVLDLMIHDIDLILSFIKSPVQSIHASGVSIMSSTEDIANCRLEFENGAVANVTASRISNRKMRKMRFFQSNAYISVDFLEGTSEVFQLNESDSQDSIGTPLFTFGTPGDGKKQKQVHYRHYPKKEINALNYELSLFIQSVLYQKPPAVSGEEAVRALIVAKQILNNIEEHAHMLKKHLEL